MLLSLFLSSLPHFSHSPIVLNHRSQLQAKVTQRRMGNCQAADAAAVVIQYPGGKVERLHWPTTAANVMKSNPGYHVALVTLYIPPNERQDGGVGNRITRVKLLKPKEMLLLGQVYRLITSQEVTKALRQRQHEKLRAIFHDFIHVLADDLFALTSFFRSSPSN